MSDIRQWLEKLGIGDYAEAFDAEKIPFLSASSARPLLDGQAAGQDHVG